MAQNTSLGLIFLCMILCGGIIQAEGLCHTDCFYYVCPYIWKRWPPSCFSACADYCYGVLRGTNRPLPGPSIRPPSLRGANAGTTGSTLPQSHPPSASVLPQPKIREAVPPFPYRSATGPPKRA